MKIEAILNDLKEWANSERPVDIMVQGVEQGRSEFMNRVFNSEVGAKDVTGKGLGKYSNPYAKFRESRGRQTKVVDLALTDSLFREIKTVRNGQDIIIAVPAVSERIKIGHLENLYKRNIFDLNDKERLTIKTVIKKNHDLDIKQIINGVL
jgi:hypothetical protein